MNDDALAKASPRLRRCLEDAAPDETLRVVLDLDPVMDGAQTPPLGATLEGIARRKAAREAVVSMVHTATAPTVAALRALGLSVMTFRGLPAVVIDGQSHQIKAALGLGEVAAGDLEHSDP